MELKEAIAALESNIEHPDAKAHYEKFITSDNGIKILQPHYDRITTKAIETYREKTVPGLIDEAVKKIVPAETPEQKRIKAIEKELQDSKDAATKATLSNLVISKLTELKIPFPPKLMHLLIGTDEVKTLENIKEYNTWYQDAKLKDNGRKKPGEKTHTEGNGLMNQQIRQAAGYRS